MTLLRPYKKLDLLYFYWKVSHLLREFLKNKEIASKIHINNGQFLRRGSKDKPLFIENFLSLDEDFFKLRSETVRDEAIKNKLINDALANIWLYFPPSKDVDFFYACNGEGQGNKIDRFFIDIDRGTISSEKAQEVAKELVKVIKNDKEFNKLIKFKIKVLWTGSSFHVYLFLNKLVPLEFYHKYLAYSKNEEQPSFISKWSNEISKKTGINVSGGHEKLSGMIILDPSGTPSGKLARVPFSFHFNKEKDAEKAIDGICLPLNEKMLEDKELVKKLKTITPEKILDKIDLWKKNL